MTTPKPATDTFPRVYRGGSWDVSTSTIVRAAFRVAITSSDRLNRLGFRLTQTGCRQQVLKGMTPP